MTRKILILFSSLAALMTCVSCVGQRQINELAIVTAVGIENGQKPGTIRLSAQIIRPSDARGQTGAPSGGTGQPIYSALAEGQTIFDAIRNLGRFVSRRVYWAHNFLIVMQEDYARNGIEDMVDFFTRNHELRMNTRVAVTSDSPAEVISTITGLEVVPGQAVDNLFQDNEIVGQAPSSDMMNLEEAYLSRSSEPILARLTLVSRGISNKKPQEHGSLKQVELAGAAVFKEGRMVGWLSPEETRGLLFFTERLESGIEVVGCPNSGNKLSLEFRDARLKVKPSYRNERPEFRIELRAKADVVESGCGTNIAKIRPDIERALEERLKGEIEALLRKAQREYHSDVLKLADVFRNKFPAEWRKIGDRWSSAFSEARVDVAVKANVKSVVLKSEESSQ
ncbi:Ger(x)C family spore germination protein [Cohnella panacarvi]|uniref:Ger(x)C family spore germination protein n=1 Tax=Cohnella panacarvi TaxID=400776 RepID=UPI00047EF9EC|nr:Ger(x)C family spore germination protein [Cohnella panacarvi]